MLNGNIFREAQQLLQVKPILEMDREELTTVNAASILLDILPEFNDLTTEQGLEELAKIAEGAKE